MSDISSFASHSHLSPLYQTILGLESCRTEKELIAETERITRSIKFDWFHYSVKFGPKNGNFCRTLSNEPASWKERHAFFDETRPEFLDQIAYHRLTPITWHDLRRLYSEPDTPPNNSDEEEIGAGIIFPIRSKNEDCAFLGFFMRNSHAHPEKTINLSLGEMCLTASYFHDAMIRMTAKPHRAPKAPLTSREIECLRLISNYKSNWVISKILGISEHGVVYYVRRLMWKLDAQNRHQAVERAAECGLI